MSTVETIVELGALERLAPDWDALAVAGSLPMASPAWMLAWWRHLAPERGELRTLVVRDRDELIGIAPFFLTPPPRGEPLAYRLLAADISTSVAPLAKPGREWEVAEAIARALAEARHRPDLLALEPMPLASPWLLALRERWPGRVRPRGFRYDVQAAPIVSLHDESFDAWLATRSAKFRTKMRRLKRLFEAEGGTMRLSTRETLYDDVATFARLHNARWQGRGHSRLVALGKGLEAMLHDAGQTSLAGDPRRFQLRLLEIAGEPICAEISIVGGGEIVGFNNGWDERFKRMSPPLLALLYDVEEGFARGDRRLQLGWGGNMYKLRFTNGNDPVAWSLLLLPGPRLPLTLARIGPLLASSWLRASGKRMLTQSQMNRLRPLASRLPR